MICHGSLDRPRREHLPTTSWWTRPGAQAPRFCCDWPGCRTLWWGDGGFCAAAWTQGRAALRGALSLQPSPADTLQAGTQLKAVYTALPQGRVGTGMNGEAEKRDPSPLCYPLPCHTPPVPWSPKTAPPRGTDGTYVPDRIFIGRCPSWGCEAGTLQTGTWDRPSSQHWSGCRVTRGEAVLSPRQPPGSASPPLLPQAPQQPFHLRQGAGPRPGLSLEPSLATLDVLWPFCSV